jgi:hypothetical protein
MAGWFEKLLRRFGYVKPETYGMTLSPEGALVPMDDPPNEPQWRSSEGHSLPLTAPTPDVEEEIESLEQTAPVPRLEAEGEDWEAVIARAKAQAREADAVVKEAMRTPATRPTAAPPVMPRRTPPALPPLRSRRPRSVGPTGRASSSSPRLPGLPHARA